MATLQDIIDQLKENNDSQQETTKLLSDWILSQERGAGDRLEDRLERARNRGPAATGALAQMREDTSSFGLPILTPITIAFMAWVADLDAYLRALRPDVLLKPVVGFFKGVKNTFGRFTTFIDEISKIRLPDISIKIPQIKFLSDAGEAITDFIDYKIKLPAINFVDDAGKVLTDFIDYKIKLPVLNFVDDAGKAIGDLLNLKIKLPVINFIDNAGKAIGDFIDISLPEGVKSFFTKVGGLFDDVNTFSTTVADKLVLPEGVKNFFTKTTKFFTDITDWFKGIEASFDLSPFLDPIKTALGFTDEAGTVGSGLLGLFGKLKGFLGVVLKPIGVVTRILAGPFVQGFLSLLDFVKGFSDAFGETIDEETGEVKTFGQRVLAGFEGGVLGVIKGITDAIELLFLDFPAWIAGQLGFEKVSQFLKDLNITEFVDPVWNWIKSIPGMIMDLIPSAEELKQMTIGMIANIPGGYYILKAMGAAGPELELARTNAAIEEAQADIMANEADIQRSLAGENVFVGFEEGGRQRAARRIEDLRQEIAELEQQRAAQQSVIIAPQSTTTNNTSTTGVNLSPRLTASDVQRMAREGLLPRGGR